MAKKKKSKKRKNRNTNLSPVDRMLRKKAEAFVRAEKEFWNYRYIIEERFRRDSEELDLKVPNTIPDNISSVVWALKDGVAFVRYYSPGRTGDVSFRSLNITLEQWGNEGLIVPTPQGEISLVQSGFIQGIGNFRLENCMIDNVHIPYIDMRHAYYASGQIPPPLERALLDFQLAFLGFQLREGEVITQRKDDGLNAINKLKEISTQFQSLLETSQREEEIQIFLKLNPMVLHPTAEVIPKKKLGEDFITDFILVSYTDQGPTYTLVEIEKPSLPILVQDYSLSSHTNHAIKQTRDWDVWIEQHKSYIQSKLPGFETPKYMVVIGRSSNLDTTAKAHIRSYNRELQNTELVTFDDLLVRFNGIIKKLEDFINIQN